jgi:hypothetical protein
MPRAKKTIAGSPGQKIQAVAGQTYGDGVRQENLQKTMPAPNVQAERRLIPAPPTDQSAPPTNGADAVPLQRPSLSFAEAMQQVQGAGGILRAPDDNPAIPVTDGLATGPGRGPEALMGTSILGNTLRRLAIQTGDPVFNELLTKVRF